MGKGKVLPLAFAAMTAFLVRLWVITIGHPQCSGEALTSAPNTCLRLMGDMQYFRVQAHYLAKGHGYLNNTALTLGRVRPGAYHPPLFPTLLGIFNLFGIRSVTGHRVMLSIVGILSVVVISVVASRLGGHHARLTGIVAAMIAALCPLIWLNDTQAMSESIYVPLVVVLIGALYLFASGPSRRRACAIGLIVGLIGLTRAEGLSMLILLVPLLWGMRSLSPKARVRLFGAALATTIVVLTPWVAYNVSRFPNTTFLTTSAGDALMFRSCDATFYGPNLGYYDNVCAPKPNLSSQDESLQDLRSRRLATEYISQHLGRLPVVLAARIGRMWEVYLPLDNAEKSGFLDNRGPTEAHLALYSFYALLVPAGFGIASLRRRGLPLSPVLGMFVLATISTAATSAVVRYRASVDVTLVLLAAVGSVEIWTRYVQPRFADMKLDLGRVSIGAVSAAVMVLAPTPGGMPSAFAAAPPSASAGASKSCTRSNDLVLLFDAYDDAALAGPAARLRTGAPPNVVARIDQVVATHGDIVSLPPAELMAMTKELSAYTTDRCSLFGTSNS